MKARILNTNFFGGIYSVEFLTANAEAVINGAKVKDWQMTAELPSQELIIPLWNNSQWTEGATQVEIDQHTTNQLQLEKSKLRAELLMQGATILESGKNYHFNEAQLQRFIVMKNEAEKGGLTAIEYEDTEGSWNVLTIAQCTNIALIGMGIFINIYKTTS